MKRYSELSRSLRPFRVDYTPKDRGKRAGFRSFAVMADAKKFAAMCGRLGFNAWITNDTLR